MSSETTSTAWSTTLPETEIVRREALMKTVWIAILGFVLVETRLYLFGHSAGAVFGMKLGLMESEYFAAVAVHAGSFRQPDEYDTIRLAMRKIPFKVIVGDRDAFFPLQSVNATVDALKARGLTVDLEVVKRHDHWYYDRAQQFNESAWNFLKEQKLASPPNYVQYKFE